MKTLSIIIPAYNEEKTILQVLDRIYEVKFNQVSQLQIIIVDDCSKDQTANLLKTYQQEKPERNIQVLQNPKNMGKGACIIRGITAVDGEMVLIQDADLEYHPNDYPSLLAPLEDGVADVVLGSRFISHKPHRVLFFWHSMGNKFITFLSNMMTNLNLTDVECGYKVFSSEIIKQLKLREQRFGIEPEIIAKLTAIRHIRIYEVGVSYYGRTYAEGKKIGIRDGFRALYCIMKYSIFKK